MRQIPRHRAVRRVALTLILFALPSASCARAEPSGDVASPSKFQAAQVFAHIQMGGDEQVNDQLKGIASSMSESASRSTAAMDAETKFPGINAYIVKAVIDRIRPLLIDRITVTERLLATKAEQFFTEEELNKINREFSKEYIALLQGIIRQKAPAWPLEAGGELTPMTGDTLSHYSKQRRYEMYLSESDRIDIKNFESSPVGRKFGRFSTVASSLRANFARQLLVDSKPLVTAEMQEAARRYMLAKSQQ